MLIMRSLRSLFGMDKTTDEHTQNLCIESAANIVRNYTGRMVIPDALNDTVLQIATILYQRRLSCCDVDVDRSKRICSRDIVQVLEDWRITEENP